MEYILILKITCNGWQNGKLEQACCISRSGKNLEKISLLKKSNIVDLQRCVSFWGTAK